METTILQKVQSIIQAHLDDDSFSVEKLSRKAAVSKPQLYRKLMATSGHSAHHIIRDMRLAKAKALLDNLNLSISAVAFESGYSDPDYFSKVFKKIFGMNPSDYRRRKPWEKSLE